MIYVYQGIEEILHLNSNEIEYYVVFQGDFIQ